MNKTKLIRNVYDSELDRNNINAKNHILDKDTQSINQPAQFKR